MTDSTLGVSLRFMRQYDATADRCPTWTTADRVLMLAMHDKREVPFDQKLRDAAAFIESRTK